MPQSLVIVTGASRGLGRAIALSIANASSENPIHMVLIARSGEKLEETARIVREKCFDVSNNIITSCHEVDLADLETLPVEMERIFAQLKEASYDRCWLFNNAGSVEPLGAISSLASDTDSLVQMKELRSAIDLNITSVMWLSSMFTSTFSSDANAPSIRIVNISSLCAKEPFSTMAVYCAGKAARDMFHIVLAKEMSRDESKKQSTHDAVKASFKVLNYAPGACDTVMTDVLADCPILDTDLHDYFINSKRDKKLIDPVDSANKLIALLIKDEYVTGSHVDYWDV